MASNRNYGPVPQAPNSPNFNPILLNTQAKNAAVLPVIFPAPLASEQFITNPALAAPLVVTVPSRSLVEGQAFELAVSGTITQLTAAATVAISLYAAKSAILASNVLLKALTATAVTATGAPFWIKASLIAVSSSGALNGTVKAMINNTLIAEAALAASALSINFQNDPVISFLLSITPSAANAGNLIVIDEFAVNF